MTKTQNRNPVFGAIRSKDAILYLQAAGYENATAKGMLKGHVHNGLIDPDHVPDYVNSSIIYGFEEIECLMADGREEFGW